MYKLSRPAIRDKLSLALEKMLTEQVKWPLTWEEEDLLSSRKPLQPASVTASCDLDEAKRTFAEHCDHLRGFGYPPDHRIACAVVRIALLAIGTRNMTPDSVGVSGAIARVIRASREPQSPTGSLDVDTVFRILKDPGGDTLDPMVVLFMDGFAMEQRVSLDLLFKRITQPAAAGKKDPDCSAVPRGVSNKTLHIQEMLSSGMLVYDLTTVSITVGGTKLFGNAQLVAIDEEGDWYTINFGENETDVHVTIHTEPIDKGALLYLRRSGKAYMPWLDPTN